MSNEKITIEESDSIIELKKLKWKAREIDEGLKKRGVSCGGYITRLQSAIDRQISKEQIQALHDEVKKIRNGEATLFEPKHDEVVELQRTGLVVADESK